MVAKTSSPLYKALLAIMKWAKFKSINKMASSSDSKSRNLSTVAAAKEKLAIAEFTKIVVPENTLAQKQWALAHKKHEAALEGEDQVLQIAALQPNAEDRYLEARRG
ncbi:hypothetical protein B7494_g1219 [Chlorociboria aeruginascens]|nr:hypothetical protein B7494_g1219 [Chlorociboria aeruginascens]